MSSSGHAIRTRRKLIEVALPLDAINAASAREKSIRHGHPSTLHLWWARRPLAAARAVIFSQMVDDPSEYVDVLRDDPKLRRKAESILRSRLAAWQEARDLARKAEGTGLDAPEPGPKPTLDAILAEQERERLFGIIKDLVQWENTTDETVLQAAREEIWASWRRACAEYADHPRARELFDRHRLPAFHDPFAGGGALPLEAQRLGLEAYASDLNPVAVLINKAMIEIPPRFAGRPPVNPESRAKAGHSGTWNGAQGLAADVRHYGQWMRDEAQRRIGHLYPPIEVTAAMAQDRPDLTPYVGQRLTVIAWLWARTVKSPNPAFAQVDVPLASTFMLSTKPGKEAYVQPVIEDGGYRFTVRVGKPVDPERTKNGTKSGGSHSAFLCLMSGTPMPFDYIRDEGKRRRIGARLMAIVADGGRGRVYLPPTDEMAAVAADASPAWIPDLEMPRNPFSVRPPLYGLDTYAELFTRRQLTALTTFSDLVGEAKQEALRDAIEAGLTDDRSPLRDGGEGALAYAEAVAVYLSFVLSKQADLGNSLCRWEPVAQCPRQLFGRQAIPMIWDYAEGNPLGDSSGAWTVFVDGVARAFAKAFEAVHPAARGRAEQADARVGQATAGWVVSADPPYYDNVDYADLSDFFYLWLRRSISAIYPGLLATLATPKAEELVATPYRHGDKERAEAFFLGGMEQAMHHLAQESHPAFPVTIYYAFKQTESKGLAGAVSTGWEAFLDAVIRAGLAVSGTWPVRTENASRMMGQEMNALASSIVLVCRPRDASEPTATRREFVAALKSELPQALAHLQRGNIAPVDLAQAAIGPGMAVYTRYAKVVDAEGKPVPVRDALALINQTLDTALAEQEGDFDADSRWALAWFEQHGFDEGAFGVADVLARAKVTSVDGMREAGIIKSGQGKVRLLRPSELDPAWDPATDSRRPAWQAVHQLVLAAEQGESALAGLIAKLGPEADTARELAYRLYVLCERKKRATEALWYNGLVQSWPEALRLASASVAGAPVQGQLFGEG